MWITSDGKGIVTVNIVQYKLCTMDLLPVKGTPEAGNNFL